MCEFRLGGRETAKGREIDMHLTVATGYRKSSLSLSRAQKGGKGSRKSLEMEKLGKVVAAEGCQARGLGNIAGVSGGCARNQISDGEQNQRATKLELE